MTGSRQDLPPEQDPPAFSLAGTMRSGMLWNLVNYVAAQGSGFVIFIILAMRLPPEIFGVVAIAAIASDFIATDGRFACTDAVVQSGRFDKTSLNSAFFAFFGVALLVAAGMIFCAHFVGQKYDAPLITTFMPLFGLMLLPVPWLAVMDSLIMRDLAFKQFTQRNVLGALTGGAVGIAISFTPWLVWALVAQRITTLIVTIVFEYRYTKWLPGLQVERSRVIDFLSRFFPLWMISALSQVVGRVSTMAFGLRYDTHTVGLFRATGRIAEAVQSPIISPLMGLWFPLMAKVRGDPTRETEVFNSILRTSSLFCLPAFAGLIIVADDVVTLLLPPQYLGSTDLLRAHGVACIVAPFAWFVPIAMSALGMNKASLIYTAVNAAACIAVLFAFPGVTAAHAIMIMTVPGVLAAVVGNAIVNRRLGQSNFRFYRGLAPAIIATAAMSAACIGVSLALEDALTIVRLVACVTTGIAIYGGWLVAFHRRWLMERVALLKGRDVAPDPGIETGHIIPSASET